MADPLHEDKDSPVQGITHRYPDRVLFLVSNVCAMYCRHCTRKRTNRKAGLMRPQDTIERYKGSIIQHGRYNDRIYLIKVESELSHTYPSDLIDLAKKNNYSKIFAKIPECHSNIFLDAGFQEEAHIPAFYSGKEASMFMGFFLNDERSKESNLERIEDILNIALGKKADPSTCDLKNGFVLRVCNETDVAMLANIYQTVFQSYPFPIYDPKYILETNEEPC